MKDFKTVVYLNRGLFSTVQFTMTSDTLVFTESLKFNKNSCMNRRVSKCFFLLFVNRLDKNVASSIAND